MKTPKETIEQAIQRIDFNKTSKPEVGKFLTLLSVCGKDKSIYSDQIVLVCGNQFFTINNNQFAKPNLDGKEFVILTPYIQNENGTINPVFWQTGQYIVVEKNHHYTITDKNETWL